MSYQRLANLFATKASPSPIEVGHALVEFIDSRSVPYNHEEDNSVLDLLVNKGGYKLISETAFGHMQDYNGETPEERTAAMVIGHVQTAIRMHHPIPAALRRMLADYKMAP